MKRSRGKTNGRTGVVTRVLRVITGEQNNVTAIIVPTTTRLAMQPSSMNEGMKSLVSLPPRVFLQSDPEMLHFRVQEALNEANSHILLQRRYVAQEKALRVEAEKELARQQNQMKTQNAQVAKQATAISSMMEELVESADRTRLEIESVSEVRYAVAICKKLLEETSRKAGMVLETVRPAVDEAKLAEQKSLKTLEELLGENKESMFGSESEPSMQKHSMPRESLRKSKAMPAPELLLFGDGEVEDTNSDISGSIGSVAEQEDTLSLEESSIEENTAAADRFFVNPREDLTELFQNEAKAVKEEFARKQREYQQNSGARPRVNTPSTSDLLKRNATADLADGGELAWLQAMKNPTLESES